MNLAPSKRVTVRVLDSYSMLNEPFPSYLPIRLETVSDVFAFKTQAS